MPSLPREQALTARVNRLLKAGPGAQMSELVPTILDCLEAFRCSVRATGNLMAIVQERLPEGDPDLADVNRKFWAWKHREHQANRSAIHKFRVLAQWLEAVAETYDLMADPEFEPLVAYALEALQEDPEFDLGELDMWRSVLETRLEEDEETIGPTLAAEAALARRGAKGIREGLRNWSKRRPRRKRE